MSKAATKARTSSKKQGQRRKPEAAPAAPPREAPEAAAPPQPAEPSEPSLAAVETETAQEYALGAASLSPEEDAQFDDVLVEMEERIASEPDEAFPLGEVPTGTLIAHCGTRKITRPELRLIAVPEATRTHQPIAHERIVAALVEALSFRHITVVREEYAVSPDGGKMFGVLDLNAEEDGVRFSVGLRNSNDKSMRLGMTVGYRVTVCDNMMFKGDFAPVLYKHTRKLDLLDVISLGVDRMQRSFAPLRAQIQSWQERLISDEQAKLVIYRAFLEDRFPRLIMPEVHRRYFEPEYEEFRPRTLWSLSNAFTSAFKLLKPMRQFTATAKLGQYLEASLNGKIRLAT